jgi:dihydropteroate synthase
VRLRLRDRTLELRPGQPLLMGILNAGPDSFSDPGERSPDALVEHAHELSDAGAAIIDVGGESGRTDREAVPVEEEVGRVAPVIERLASDGISVSVDTWRAPVARAALDAGAAMVNDVSALSDPPLAEACAEVGAALVVTHTRAEPKRKVFPSYDDVVDDTLRLWRERAAAARELGVGEEQLVLDPGIDLAKTPGESVELLRRLRELEAPERPLLLAISRKDFIGALTGRPPSGRGAGTLAALEVCASGGPAIVRLHEVAAAVDYLRVRAALRGEEVPENLHLAQGLRREGVTG